MRLTLAMLAIGYVLRARAGREKYDELTDIFRKVTQRFESDCPSPVVRGQTVLRSPLWMRLSRGMTIRAAVEARLLGKRLLTLDADIVVMPAEPFVLADPGKHLENGGPRRGANGDPGPAPLEASRALESGAAALREARGQIP